MNSYPFNQIRLKNIELTLGDDVEVYWWKSMTNCRFVKVTRKGFNILDLNTNRMIFKRHLYGLAMAGKEYPRKGNFKVKVRVPQDVHIKVKKERLVG